jgi:lipoprotein-anchoring transpeptidase ErfK/SrfK
MSSSCSQAPRVGAGRPWASGLRGRRCLAAVACVGLSLAATATASAASPAASRTARVPAVQQLAVLDYGHLAYRYPRTSSASKMSILAHRPITGQVTTLPVIGQSTTRSGQRWLKVMLPGRPNSSTGWIKRAGTRPAATTWYIHVSLAARQVAVYHLGRLTRTFSAVVGKPSTPTPTGTFFVEETVIMPGSEPGGPYALALSARSNVLQEFDGGPGQIGIHGRDGLGGTPGLAESHGCMRLNTPDIDWLAFRILPGTRVTIS